MRGCDLPAAAALLGLMPHAEEHVAHHGTRRDGLQMIIQPSSVMPCLCFPITTITSIEDTSSHACHCIPGLSGSQA